MEIKRMRGAPNRLKEVQPYDDLLALYETRAKNRCQKRADAEAISVEAYLAKIDAHVKHLLKDAGLWMRCRPLAFSQILACGRFKSQFETHTSGGSLTPTGRADCEQALFSYPDDLDPKKRPVYGYMTASPDGILGGLDYNDKVGQYGKIAVHFKRDLVVRKATFTFDDSLGEASLRHGKSISIVATPCAAPSHRAINLYRLADALSLDSLDDIYPYPEVQYHKGLRVKHIEEVVFFTHYDITTALTDAITAHGIPYRFVGC